MAKKKDPPYTDNIYSDKDDIYSRDKKSGDAEEDLTTGDIHDSEDPHDPDDELDDDENITGDEEIYESVENEDAADQEDVLQEQADLEAGDDIPDFVDEDEDDEA